MTDRSRPTNGSSDRRRATRGRLKPLLDAFYRLLRFIWRHVRGFYAAVLTYLSFSVFVGLAAVWAFAELADRMLAGATRRLDEAVVQWVATHRSRILDHVALEITGLGNFATLTVLVLVAAIFLWQTRHRVSVVLMMIAIAGGGVLNTLLKDLYGRPRPSIVTPVIEVATESFPSGHSMGAFIAYAAVAYLGGRVEPTRGLRWTTWIVAAVLILAIGVSRVYLGVHYPSDVLGGYIAGLAWLAFVFSGLTAIRYYAGGKEPVD